MLTLAALLLITILAIVSTKHYRHISKLKQAYRHYPPQFRLLMATQPGDVHAFNGVDLPNTVCKRSRNRSEDKQKRDG